MMKEEPAKYMMRRNIPRQRWVQQRWGRGRAEGEINSAEENEGTVERVDDEGGARPAQQAGGSMVGEKMLMHLYICSLLEFQMT